MRTIFLLVFLILSYQLFSQDLIWENEIHLIEGSEVINQSFSPTIIDSDGNIVVACGIMIFPYFCNTVYILKYNSDGLLLIDKKYEFDKMVFPLSIYENETGYSIFCSTGLITQSTISFCLPFILNITKTGDTINTLFNYDIFNSKQYYTEFGFIPVSNSSYLHINSVITINKQFYNASIKKTIPINENTSVTANHIIVSKYNQNGVLEWKLGIDTLSVDGRYFLRDIKKSKSGNLLILTSKELKNQHKSYHYVEIREVSTDGEILNTIVLPYIEDNWLPNRLIELENGEYIVLGFILNHYGKASFVKINNNGDLINKVDILEQNILNNMINITAISDNEILLNGTKQVETSNSFIFIKYNSDLEYISEYEYKELQGSQNIKHLHFINEHEYIGVGYTALHTFYIAKFGLQGTNINDAEIKNISIYPNPSTDILHINTTALITNTELTDILGRTVFKQSGNVEQINTAGLAPGLYLLKLYTAGGEVVTEKVVVR